MPRTDITKPIAHDQYSRAEIARGLAEGKDAIEREGGDRKAGLIRGAAVITRGEARGHRTWVDATMLDQVADAINNAGTRGVKARFTHPGLSSDGLGTFLGRFKNAARDGDVVRADLHFAASSHKTPDGDLASYLMDLAEEDPDAFGTSIVFRHDLQAEEEFEAANTDSEPDGKKRFKSPDPENVNHYPHARLKSLRAVDAVDSPAANPNGLFHAQALGPEAEALMSYSLGLSPEKPSLTQLSIDPDRFSGFVSRFLDRHGLAIAHKEPPVKENFSKEELQKFTDAFGADGVNWLMAGHSFEKATALHAAKQQEAAIAEKDKALAAKDAELQTALGQVAEITKQRDELQAKFNSLGIGGEEEGVSFTSEGGDEGKPDDKYAAKVGNRLASFAAGLKLKQAAK